MTVDLVAFLRARLDEDEVWARGCSTPYQYADEGSKAPRGGVRWHWVVGENWEPVTLDPTGSEFVAEPGESCNLATVEEWPCTRRDARGEVLRVQQMSHTYANDIIEMETAAAGHIALHDPARVLAEVDAKRRIIDAHQPETRTVLDGANTPSTHEFCDTCTEWIYPCETLRLLALPYADHPGYHREEWAP